MLEHIFKGIIFALGLILLVLITSLITTIYDYKKETDKENKRQLKSEVKTLAITLVCLALGLTGSIVGTSAYLKKEKLYEYKDVTSSVETIETLYEVCIDKVISLKNEEKEYHIALINNKMVGETPDGVFDIKEENHPLHRMYGDIYVVSDKISGFRDSYNDTYCDRFSFDEIKLVLSESEYNSIVGTGNNHLRMDVHILTLNTEKFHGKEHEVALYRLGCFGEAFSEEEVNEISEQFLDAANARDCENRFNNSALADFVVVHQ